VAISSYMDACPAKPLPFEDYLSTQTCQTGPRNKPQEKQTREPLAMIYTWIVSSLMQKSRDDETSTLPLCVWKPAFVKSGHKLIIFESALA